MRNVIVFALFLSSIAMLATPAVAQVEADLQAGRRWAETKTDGEVDGVQMQTALFSARYGILNTGLSVGPSFSYSKFREDDIGEGSKASHYELGLDAKYGYQVTPWLTPFAKARFIGYSRGTVDFDSDGVKAEMNFRTYGAQFGLGAAFAVTENLQLTAEAGYGVQMIRSTGGKLKSVTADDGSAIALTEDQKTLPGGNRDDFNSKSFMVGLNVSI